MFRVTFSLLIIIFRYLSPRVNTQQDTNYTAACLPSRKLYKLDEPDTQDTAGEARTNSSVMYYYGPPHMAKQKQDDQLEHTYIQQLCEDTGCNPEDLPKAMNDREKWRERVRDIRAGSTTWWWWWWWWWFLYSSLGIFFTHHTVFSLLIIIIRYRGIFCFFPLPAWNRYLSLYQYTF